MSYRISNFQFPISVLPCLSWAMAMVFEGAACFLLVKGLSTQPLKETLLLSSFALHLLASIPIFCIPRIRSERERTGLRFYSTLSGWLTLFLPVIGIVGVSLALLWAKKIMRAKGVVEDFQKTTDYSLEERHVSHIIRDIETFLSDEVTIEPILDILPDGDEDLKRGAVNLLGRIGSPSAIRLLRKCLTDSSTEVRFYAHSTLETLNENYAGEIKEAQALIDGDDGHRKDHFEHLGQKYREYAESGLLEDETRNHYLQLAKETYSELLAHFPDDPEIPIILGDLSISKGEFAEAERYFKAALKSHPDPVDLLLGLCRIYYEKGDAKSLTRVVSVIRRMKDKRSDDIQKDILFQFWGNPQEV